MCLKVTGKWGGDECMYVEVNVFVYVYGYVLVNMCECEYVCILTYILPCKFT